MPTNPSDPKDRPYSRAQLTLDIIGAVILFSPTVFGLIVFFIVEGRYIWRLIHE